MKLVVLGSTGYHPTENRHTASLAIPEAGVVLDAGTGFFRMRDYLATDTLDIFLTHVHLDHSIGITFLFDVFSERPDMRATIHGEAAKLAAIQEHMIGGLLFPVALPCDYRPLSGAVSLAGGGRLTHFAADHPGGVVGFRLEWPGHSMAYVTDTTASPDAEYVRHIAGVDLLVHECYFPDSESEMARLTGHSCTTPVAQVARQAGVQRLLLTHLWPRTNDYDPIGLDVARAIFPATALADDLMEVEF